MSANFLLVYVSSATYRYGHSLVWVGSAESHLVSHHAVRSHVLPTHVGRACRQMVWTFITRGGIPDIGAVENFLFYKFVYV